MTRFTHPTGMVGIKPQKGWTFERMMATVNMHDVDIQQKAVTQEQLEHLFAALTEDGLQQAALRIRQLADRLGTPDGGIFVALAGLFSAGKSSLINALMGSAVTATGAVPTTSAVQSVNFETPGGPIILMDTPGIDSTDEAHQQVTEATLHLVDIVCLVVDYSHVESEETLEFGRVLCERGLPLVLVVHQIDKHMEMELSFASFRERVEATFADYGIEPQETFYTSVQPSEYNELAELKARLVQFAEHAPTVVNTSIRANAAMVIEEALRQKFDERRTAAERTLEETLGEQPLDEDEAQSWSKRLREEIRAGQRELQAQRTALEASLVAAQEDLIRSVDLGQIAPYDTTERGRRFVESLRPGFKVGWLNTKKRTDEEQTRRLEEFRRDLADRLQKNLIWPLQNEVRAFVQSHKQGHDGWLTNVDRLSVEVSPSLLHDAVNRGALESVQYPYQYVKEVTNRVKSAVKTQVNQMVKQWQEDAAAALEAEQEQTKHELEYVSQKLRAVDQWLQLNQEERALRADYLSYLPSQ